jgi:hypothetical protein
MIRNIMVGVCAALCAVLLMANAAHAVSPANKCEAAKLKIAGKYDFCRLKAEATAAKRGGSPDFSKCDPSFSGKWTQAEMTAGGMCPSNGDEAAIEAFITEHSGAIEAALDGGTLPEGVLTCNGNLATCTTTLGTCNASLATCLGAKIGVLKTGQTTPYGTGSDGDLQKGASRSYTDNGDGTITDNTTGLMWEKKSWDNSIHTWTNGYTWSDTITTFLAALNGGGGFAGHTDWRIPNINELHTLANYENFSPSVDSVFNTNCVANCTVTTCSCTQSNYYWSSTTYAPFSQSAWIVGFNVGYVDTTDKSMIFYVRAVRGGL